MASANSSGEQLSVDKMANSTKSEANEMTLTADGTGSPTESQVGAKAKNPSPGVPSNDMERGFYQVSVLTLIGIFTVVCRATIQDCQMCFSDFCWIL